MGSLSLSTNMVGCRCHFWALYWTLLFSHFAMSSNCLGDESSQKSVDELIVQTPLDIVDSLPIVTAVFEDKPFAFILDTGAVSSWFRADQRKLLSSNTKAFYSKNPTSSHCFRIGGERFWGAVGFLPDDPDFAGITPRAVGVLGMDLFRDYAIEINPDEKVFRVYDRVPEEIAKQSEYVLRMKSGSSVELDLNDNKHTTALLDTASEYGITLEQPLFDQLISENRIGYCIESRSVRLDGSHDRLSGQLIGEPLCDLLKGSVVVHQAATPNTRQSTTNIGWPVLRRFISVFDFTRNRVLLRKSRYFDEHEVLDRSGITFVRTDDGILIHFCKKSPAHDADIEPGSFLMQIDDQPTIEMPAFEIMKRLSVPGKPVKLSLRQNSGDKDVTIVPRDFQQTIVPQARAEGKLLTDIQILKEQFLLVAMEIKGQKVSAVFDTSAGSLVLDAAAAVEMGVAGDSPSAVAENIKCVRVGHESWNVDRAFIRDLTPLGKALDAEIKAVIGPNLFRNQIVLLNLGKNQIQIFDRVPKSILTEFECCKLKGDQNGIKITASIPGYGLEDFYLASGMYYPLSLREETYDALGPGKLLTSHDTRETISSTGSADLTSGHLRNLMICTQSWKQIEAIRYEKSCIGMQLLQKMVVVLDLKNHCCYIKKVTP